MELSGQAVPTLRERVPCDLCLTLSLCTRAILPHKLTLPCIALYSRDRVLAGACAGQLRDTTFRDLGGRVRRAAQSPKPAAPSARTNVGLPAAGAHQPRALDGGEREAELEHPSDRERHGAACRGAARCRAAQRGGAALISAIRCASAGSFSRAVPMAVVPRSVLLRRAADPSMSTLSSERRGGSRRCGADRRGSISRGSVAWYLVHQSGRQNGSTLRNCAELAAELRAATVHHQLLVALREHGSKRRLGRLANSVCGSSRDAAARRSNCLSARIVSTTAGVGSSITTEQL